MFHVQPIDSLDLPELAPYRTMKRPLEHREQGIFVAEGEKVARRLLESQFGVISALLPEKWLPGFEPLLRARPENIPVYIIRSKDVLEQLVGFSMFQGVMAVGKIPAPKSLENVISTSPRPRLFAAVDALTNAENLGVLVRNCVAFGAQALLVGETSSSPFLRRAVRNSMGTVFQLPVIELKEQASTLPRALGWLHEHGVRCVAAHPHTTGRTIFDADLGGDCCIVFGSEGYGISAQVLEACDEAAAIPMPASVDSLNVGSAAAVFLYEIARQRRS